MARFSALLDACTLVPIALTDTLLRLAETELYRPLWSTKILDEMVDALESLYPDMANGAAQRRAEIMTSAFEDACVIGWEDLESGLTLPDPDDRHVLAAALRGRADVIVTANLTDFPNEDLLPFGLEAQNPDEFLLNQLTLDPERTMKVILEQCKAAKRPALTIEGLLDTLRRSGVPNFADEAKRQLWRIREPREPKR